MINTGHELDCEDFRTPSTDDEGEAHEAEADIEPRRARSMPRTDEPELARLVCRLVHQDEAALAMLYRAMAHRVHRQALRLTHDSALAEEVVEDVFWQIWRQAPRFDPNRGSATAWMMQIARSRAIDALRALGRNPLYQALQIDAAADHEPVAGEGTPEQQLDRARLASWIDDALRALEPPYRQLLSLAFQSGYSQAEIAVQTGLPLGTVKSRIRRGLAKMKDSLARRGLRAAGDFSGGTT